MKIFYKNVDCEPAVLKKFRSSKGVKKSCGPMSAKDLKKNRKNRFKKIIKYCRGKKSITSTAVKDVATALYEKASSGAQTCSVWGIGRFLYMPVFKI